MTTLTLTDKVAQDILLAAEASASRKRTQVEVDHRTAKSNATLTATIQVRPELNRISALRFMAELMGPGCLLTLDADDTALVVKYVAA